MENKQNKYKDFQVIRIAFMHVKQNNAHTQIKEKSVKCIKPVTYKTLKLEHMQIYLYLLFYCIKMYTVQSD